MEEANHTCWVQFFFRPFSMDSNAQVLIFVAFLVMYLLSLTGNGAIGLTIWTNYSLYTPMYFFLANLAILEIFYTTAIAPLAMTALLTMGRTPVPLASCGTQMFFFVFLGGADCILLAVMAYDRFVAICHPLHYRLIMSWRLCIQLTIGALVLGFLLSLTLTSLIFQLPFRGNIEINHFYCDMPAVMRLAHADTRVHETALHIVSFIILAIPATLIFISYVSVGMAISQIRSVEGRHRALSTCSSHITVVLLQYGCTSFIYLSPSDNFSPEMGQGMSVVYTFITPVLNPVIYSMRNKLLKDALKKTLRRCLLPQRK
ncbi:olfactory receptor 10V1-like [Tachyglossus aculeatus]|uniref:olfactory receptor 10V1-like n=1 Tax=Tachyglossus aculeatus TaxID=9261 RepID=UPI0018F7C705|nr:olfactory receptor 10V1-like [Tachyglossus aculeatus]